MSSIGSIYVEVRGDSTQFKKDITAIRSVAKKGSKEISDALNSGIQPGKASAAVGDLTASLKQLAQSAKVPAANFKATTNEITRALEDVAIEAGMTAKQFAVLNEKMLRTQVMKTAEQSMRKVANVAGLTKNEIKALGLQMGYTGKQATAMANKLSGTRRGMQNLGSSLMSTRAKIISVGLAFAGVVYTIKRTSDAIWEAGQRTLVAENAYKSITGSVGAANKQFAFLRDTSKELGLNFYTLREGYKGFLAAANSSTLPMKEIQKIFTSVSNAGAILGLSNEKMSLTFLALEQMLSKGKVSMEEIRRQMGDSLPGAFQLGAKAMGMTVEAFDKAVSAGRVYADDFLPKFSKAMDEMYVGTIADSVKAVNLLKESWEDLKVGMAKAGFMESASIAMANLTEILKDPEVITALNSWAKMLGEILVLTGKLAGVGLDRMVAFTNFIKGVGEYAKGNISFSDWILADPREMTNLLKQIELAEKADKAFRDGAVLTQEQLVAAIQKTQSGYDKLLKKESGYASSKYTIGMEDDREAQAQLAEYINKLGTLKQLLEEIKQVDVWGSLGFEEIGQNTGSDIYLSAYIDHMDKMRRAEGDVLASRVEQVRYFEEQMVKAYQSSDSQKLKRLKANLAAWEENGNAEYGIRETALKQIADLEAKMLPKQLKADDEKEKAIAKITDALNKLTMTDSAYKINAIETWYAEQVAIMGTTAALKELYRLKLAGVPDEENIPLETSTKFLKEDLEKEYSISTKMSKVDYGEINAAWQKMEEDKLKITEEFDRIYNELGKSKFDLEREQIERMAEIYEQAGVDRNQIERLTAAQSIRIAQEEQIAKLDIYQSAAGGIAETFNMIAQSGAKQSKEAFIAYKAFAMVEAAIAGHKAILLALGDPSIPPTPAKIAMAAIVGAMAFGQIAMIASAQPPSYDSGGISSARGIYQTGDISEAHIPIPSGGKIPVKVEEKESKPREIVIMNAVHPSVFDEYQSSSRGQKAFLNLISSNAGSIRRIIR